MLQKSWYLTTVSTKSCQLLLQGSVITRTRLRCDGTFSDEFITSLLSAKSKSKDKEILKVGRHLVKLRQRTQAPFGITVSTDCCSRHPVYRQNWGRAFALYLTRLVRRTHECTSTRKTNGEFAASRKTRRISNVLCFATWISIYLLSFALATTTYRRPWIALWGCVDRPMTETRHNPLRHNPPVRTSQTFPKTNVTTTTTRMWVNVQRDGRPAEYRWRPLFNAAKFGWRPYYSAVR